MESMMPSMAPATFYCYNPDPARQHGQFIQHPQQMPVFTVVPTLPSTPVYSRPSSSCSQTAQPQPFRSLTSVPTSLMTPMPSPPAPASAIVHSQMMNKPTIMLETELHDFDGSRYPSTPPLSTASSTGSPGGCDMLATPLNPMFSGFDSFHGLKDVTSDMTHENLALAGWSSCSSPPLTPVFIHPQTQTFVSGSGAGSSASVQSSELLSVSACPSLSPSPSPYPRSIASEQDNDFCDPRNLTVSALDADLSPEFSATLPSSLSVTGDVEDELLLKAELPAETTTSAVDLESAFHGLPFDEFPELESEDDFVNGLVNLGGELSTSSVASLADVASRSRASSSLSSASDFECDQFFDTWESTSPEAESQQNKRQRTASGSMPVFAAAGESCTSGNAEQAVAASDEQNEASDNNTRSAGSASPDNAEANTSVPAVPVPTNRRGRKQSLTEDPSKIFACDLCNRRFRRQEHLKRHYRSLHTQEKPFSCHECGKKFSRSDNLAQHARTHGAGAFVMNLYDDPEIVAAATGSYPAHAMYAQHAVSMGEDYSSMGRVLFQVAAEIPGSASEISDDSDAQGKKKRKRAE